MFSPLRRFATTACVHRVASRGKPRKRPPRAQKPPPQVIMPRIEPVGGGNGAPTALKAPARQYPLARRLKRDVHLHIGPTNSGKSYAALNAFKAATTGFYAGPLRMLAREIYDRMEAENVPCNLITGDEIMEKEGAGLNSGTVEMMDLSREMDVAVIDEIQMIADPNRGWAWTRALLGVRAQQLHLCGDPNSESIVARMLEETGDVLHVHRYERLSPLEVMEQPLVPVKTEGRRSAAAPAVKAAAAKRESFYKHLQPGDCVVAFSKKNVQSLRDSIVQAFGGTMCCSVIYGSLPPETRAEQARQFNESGTGVDFLVASDAIGMGLNLGIKRVIFSTLKKFDGESVRELDTSEIKQIAGRAGRFKASNGSGSSEAGLVTALDAGDIPKIRRALARPTPNIDRAVIMPTNQLIRAAMFESGISVSKQGAATSASASSSSSVLALHPSASPDPLNDVRFSHVLTAVLTQNAIGKNYCKPRWESSAEVAKLFDRVRNLSIGDRMVLANAPVPTGMPVVSAAFRDMCKVIGNGQSFNALQLFPQMIETLARPAASEMTQTLEVLHKTLTLFLWLSYRFPCNFMDRAGAVDLKRLCEQRFAGILRNSRRRLATTAPPSPSPRKSGGRRAGAMKS